MRDTTIMTVDQLLHSPMAGERVELVAGVVHRMTPAGFEHGRICVRVICALGQYVLPLALGELFSPDTGFLLERDPDTLRCPDVAFVSAERLRNYERGDGMVTAPPDLAVEILSLSNSPRYVRDKIRDYFEAGVRLVWVIDPGGRTVAIWRPDAPAAVVQEDDIIDGADVLPGFFSPVAMFFARAVRD